MPPTASLTPMPTFQFFLHTTGIRYQPEGEDDGPAIGFYAVRRIRAKDSEEALAAVMREFDSDEAITKITQTGHDAGLRPKTEVEETHKMSWLEALIPWRHPGLIFYSEDEDGEKG